MFSRAQDFLRREKESLPIIPCAHCRRVRAMELQARSIQLLREVTRWMERNA